MKKPILALLCLCVFPAFVFAQEWTVPVRGSWVRAQGSPQTGDIVIVTNGRDGCEIVVGSSEHTAVKQAASFLAGDIEKISGYKPPIVSTPSGSRVAIRFETRSDGRWEATVRKLAFSAMEDLKTLEVEIKRAERPPFELWYRKTWIRNDDSPYNLHRSYERTQAFLTENYLKP